MFYGCDLEYEVDDADPDVAKKLKERVSTSPFTLRKIPR